LEDEIIVSGLSTAPIVDPWDLIWWLLRTFYADVLGAIAGIPAAVIEAMPEWPSFPSLEEIERAFRDLIEQVTSIPEIIEALPSALLRAFLLPLFGPIAPFIPIFGLGWFASAYLPAAISARTTQWRKDLIADLTLKLLGPEYEGKGLYDLLSSVFSYLWADTYREIAFDLRWVLFKTCWWFKRPVHWEDPAGVYLAELVAVMGEWLYERVEEMGGKLAEWLVQNVIGEEYRGKPMATIFTAAALEMLEGAIALLTPTAHLIWEWALEQGGNILEGALPFINTRVRPALAWAQDSLVSSGEAMLRSMEYALPRGRWVTPDDAYEIGGSLFSMAFAFGTGAHFTAALLDAIPFVDALGLQQLAGFIAEMGSFQEISRSTYGVLINQAVAWPMRYYVNREYRPLIPPTGEIYMMGRKRGITYEKFCEAMALQGLSDWWIDTIYHFFWTDPSPFWISRICESGIPDWHPDEWWSRWADTYMPGWREDPYKWVRAKLLLAGYEAADVDSMIEGICMRLLDSPTTQLKTSVRGMIRDGWWWRGEVEGLLRPRGVRQDEIELMYAAEQLDYQHGVLEKWVDIYTEQRRKGEFTEEDHRLALASLGMHPIRLEQEVLMESVRLLPKPTAPAAPKPSPEEAKILSDYTQAYIELYRVRAIDLWQLYVYLLTLGYTEARAKATAFLEGTRRLKLPKLDDPYFLADLWREVMELGGQRLHDHFRAGRITEAQYLAFLIGMGWPIEIAQYIVDLDVLQLFMGEVPAG